MWISLSDIHKDRNETFRHSPAINQVQFFHGLISLSVLILTQLTSNHGICNNGAIGEVANSLSIALKSELRLIRLTVGLGEYEDLILVLSLFLSK